jgi:hypothetical protein
MAHFFVDVSTQHTYPLLVGVYSAFLGLFIPSAGGKWLIEAPYMLEAARTLHVHLGWVVQTYNATEALANLIHPFWMLPLLGILGLKARDVMGVTFTVFLVLFPLVLVLVTVLGGGVAAYLLLTQLAQVDLGQVLARAQWGWGLGVLGFAALTITGASLVITGAVTARLSFARTYLTQLAVAFSGLVAPSAIGNIALNLRYLQRAGVDPAVAGGSIGLAQLAQFSSYFVLLLLSSVLAGTGQAAAFTPPLAAVIGVIAVVALLLVTLAVPAGRRLIMGRFLPVVRRVVPRMIAIFQDPRKVITLFAGALLLDPQGNQSECLIASAWRRSLLKNNPQKHHMPYVVAYSISQPQPCRGLFEQLKLLIGLLQLRDGTEDTALGASARERGEDASRYAGWPPRNAHLQRGDRTVFTVSSASVAMVSLAMSQWT